jgi:hypothetical protein
MHHKSAFLAMTPALPCSNLSSLGWVLGLVPEERDYCAAHLALREITSSDAKDAYNPFA